MISWKVLLELKEIINVASDYSRFWLQIRNLIYCICKYIFYSSSKTATLQTFGFGLGLIRPCLGPSNSTMFAYNILLELWILATTKPAAKPGFRFEWEHFRARLRSWSVAQTSRSSEKF